MAPFGKVNVIIHCWHWIQGACPRWWQHGEVLVFGNLRRPRTQQKRLKQKDSIREF